MVFEDNMFVFTVVVLGVLHSAVANPICDADTALEAKSQCAIITGSHVSGLVEHPALHFEESGYIDTRYNAKTLDNSLFADSFAFPEQVQTGLHVIRGTSKMNFLVNVDTMDGYHGYIRSEPEKSARLRKRRHLPEGCQEIMEQDKSLVATVKRVDIAYAAVGLIPGHKDPITLSAVVEFSGDSPDVRGVGLWKLSMYGSKNADGTGEQFQRVDQMLSNDQQTMALVDGEFINFGLTRGEIDITEIGCEKDFRYLCFDFMKGEHATPDFSFTSSQLNRLKTPDTKWTNCSNRCEQIQGTVVARGMQTYSEVRTENVNPGEKPPLTADITVMFSQTSDDISGTGLWKLSIYGSKTENGMGEKFQLTDQLLSDAHQAQPLTNGGNITFHDIRGHFDEAEVGCGEAFRYICFDFTKGDHSSIDFTFVFGGSSKVTFCSDRCPPVDEGSAILDNLRVSLQAINVTQGKKDDVTINATATFREASADVIGTGLWKLSLYGSNNRDGNGEQFQRVDQVLSVNQQSQPLLKSKELVFVNAKGKFDIVAVGCDLDFKYLCFELTKGVNPNPDFGFVTFGEDTTRHALCLDRCEQRRGETVVRSLSVRWTATDVKLNQKDPFTMNATIGFSEATDYVSGTGLWKLSMYGSPNGDGTGEQFQRNDQMLTSQHQSQPLVEGTREAMVFYNVQGELDIMAIGCGKKFRYVCFDISQGANPNPNFIFTSFQEDNTKLTLCTDQCKPSADLNVDNGFILVTDLAGAIRAAPLDGESGVFSFQDIPVPNIHAPVAIDFDPVHQKIYFTDVVSKTINRCNLDGSAREVLVNLPNEATPDGLTIATNQRVMYWTDASLQRIEKADLNGGNREVILNSPKPRAIVVDPNNQWFYWTDWGAQPKIEKANTDGTNRETLIDSGLQWPNGLTVDFAAERMYWCDAGANKIESADLDGMNRITHLSTGTALDIHPYDIGIYQGNILWSDWAFKQLLQISTAPNSQPGFFGQAVFTRAGGLHIHPGTLRSRREVSLSGPFTSCHDVIDPDKFFNDCTRNWCSAQSYPQFCDDIAAYAEACESHGVFIGGWRDSVGCDV